MELLYEFIEEPSRAAQRALSERPLGLGLLGILAGSLSLYLAQSLFGRIFFPTLSVFSMATACLGAALSGVLLAGVLHLLADFWRCDAAPGAASALFVLLGLSELAWAPVLPAALILKAAGLASWATSFLLCSAGGWLSLRLKARSLQGLYGLPSGKAWSLLLLPYLAVAAGLFIGLILLVLGTTLSLARLAGG